MADERLSIAERKARVLDDFAIDDVVEREVKLSGSRGSPTRRGKCPLHGSNSASFSVNVAAGYAHCFGCGFHGDVIQFVEAQKGLAWIDALAALEQEAGYPDAGAVRGEAKGMVRRERAPTRRRERERDFVSSLEAGRAIWKMAVTDHDAVRRYFLGRQVPAAMLTDERLFSFRYCGLAPVMAWERGSGAKCGPRSVPQAPAVVALVREPRWLDTVDGQHVLEFVPIGVHVTYLNPDGTGTMVRRKPWAKADDEDPLFPKRKMYGPVGVGAVLLGRYHPDAALYVGEGNETVLSGMGLALENAPGGGHTPGRRHGAAGDISPAGGPPPQADAIGIATLSLDNLQGHPRKWKGGIWPLHAIEPDSDLDRRGFVIPGHRGPVTGLIDSDMAPLRGRKHPKTGAYLGEKVVDRKGGPIVERAITGAERARICAELFVKKWRAAGAVDPQARRAPAGMDFNDVVQAEAA